MRAQLLSNTTLVGLLSLIAAACGSGDGGTGPDVPASALHYSQISAGYFHSCGLASNGKAYCWGGNAFGTLGDATRTSRTLPTAVATSRTFTALDAGAGHNCALTSTGSAWCWGRNDEGQAGDGTFIDRDAPVAVSGGLTFTSISAGHAHSCGLVAGGVAYCWGDDTRGQLGNGPPEGATKSSVPVRVQASVAFTRVIAGYYQTCALAATGDVYCWGANDQGQNGDGTTQDRHEPVRVGGNHVFTDLSPGDRFVCGISAGTVWCWGANRFGELGRTADNGSPTPVPIAGVSNATSVWASSGTSTVGSADAYACALLSGGGTSCWGGAVRGLRTRNPYPSGLDDRVRITTMAAGAEHICGLNRDGYAFCGGANYEGQLGDGTSVDHAQLVAIPGPAQ